MRKIFCLLAVAVLLPLVALAETAEKTKPEQPKIIDPEIKINLDEKTIEISFYYEKVAGHIDNANIMVVLEIIRSSGEINLNFINVKITSPRKEGGDGITPDVLTQGKSTYSIAIPEKLQIDYPQEVVGAGVAIADCLGRKSLPVFIGNQSEEKEKKKFEI